MVRLFFFLSLFLPSGVTHSNDIAYTGLWWNEERTGIFELVLREGSIEGLARWGKNPRNDIYNPNPALKGRFLKDVVFLWGFTFDTRKKRYEGGKVYDPDTGKTYDASMTLEEGGKVLRLRGFVGTPLLGRTARFERVRREEIPEALAEQMRQQGTLP